MDSRVYAERATELFFQSSNVDGATRDKLLEMVARSVAEQNDILQVGPGQGLTPEQLSKLRLESVGRLQEQVADLLGPEQGTEFMKIYAARSFVPLARDFAARCESQGEPLTPSATAAIAVNFASNLRSPEYKPALLPDGTPINEDMAFKAAAQVLTPGQFDLFKKMWSEHPYPLSPIRPRPK